MTTSTKLLPIRNVEQLLQEATDQMRTDKSEIVATHAASIAKATGHILTIVKIRALYGVTDAEDTLAPFDAASSADQDVLRAIGSRAKALHHDLCALLADKRRSSPANVTKSVTVNQYLELQRRHGLKFGKGWVALEA